jgi:nicotinamide phosphoribosyltransferase
VTVDGEDRDVFKNPVTDKGKQSKRGKLQLVNEDGTYHTMRFEDCDASRDRLVEVFFNGEIKRKYAFNEIRKNANP